MLTNEKKKISDKIKSIPHSPGCYQFKDNHGMIIYIGKAKDLAKRVSSYFQKKDHDPKTQVLVSQIDDVDFIATDSEAEALILENNLIKKYSPKYNIDLKDSKRYAYLMITEEKYPRLLLARNKSEKGRYYGPFVSADTREEVRELLIKTFKIRTCKKLPKKECLRYHIGLCSAPCIGAISDEEYEKNVESAEFVLSGKVKELIKKLEDEMKNASKQKRFEEALKIREKISALSWLTEKQKMERDKSYDEDIISYKISSGKVYLMLFNVHNGMLENKQSFVFDFKEGFLSEFILLYYSENKRPKELIVPEEIDENLSEIYKFRIIVPKIAEKKKLIELVDKNIELTFFSGEAKLVDLKEKLRLPELPMVIECFDISHLSGTATVASMVQFRQGLPDKSNYRRFKIKSVDGIDDFSSIAEVVRRRYLRLIEEKKEMPDLIIIDGGAGQLSSAISELNKLGLKIPTISIAKKFEEIYFPGRKMPLVLDAKTKALKYIQQIRDEAHRFAISYNRLLRKKSLTEDD